MADPTTSTPNCVRIKYEDLRSLAGIGIGANYVLIGSVFENPVRLLKVWNNTDADLLISHDGISNKDFIATKSGFVYDYGSNRAEPGGNLEQPVGQAIWMKQDSAAPTTGSVYVTVIYAGKN